MAKDAPDQIKKDMEKYGYSAVASIGLWSILDIPEDPDKNYDQPERIYIAPAFERTTSYAKTKDTLELAMANMVFDLAEIAARRARRDLKEIRDSIPAIGAAAIMFMTVKQDMENNRKELFNSYLKEVYIRKIPGAYTKWRSTVDTLLMETAAFATTPEECYRFLSNKPTQKGYIMAPTVIPAMEKKKD